WKGALCKIKANSSPLAPPLVGLATPPSILRTPYQGGWAGPGTFCLGETSALSLAAFSPSPPARPIARLEILLRISSSPLRENPFFFFPTLLCNTFGLCRLPSGPSANPLRQVKETRERGLAIGKNEAAPGKGGGGPPALFLRRRDVRPQLEAVRLRGIGLAGGRIRIAPALLRQASYGTIKIGIYQSLKRLFVNRLEDETLLINVICGVISGVISSALANPTDVLKIRMQAQGSLFQGGMIGSFIDIYQQEGTRGLWRGVVPTAQRAAIVVGVELPVYDITKKHLILSGLMGDTILTHFISSFTCGLAGAIASNPVDVVRTRMMNQRAIVGSVDLYRGTIDGLVKTWKSEGFFALYKGFWPNWLRLGPWNIIFFITYEQLKRLPF
uniref:Solute carrier family 25 member 14 n=1 Tax=Laticauda laticaudata TaxID=8630 RepID=A0A8C5WUN2_LATLA